MVKKTIKGRARNVEELAKDLSKTPSHARLNARRKGSVGSGASGDASGTVGDARSIPPLVRLIQSLGEEKIRFQSVGMTAAILQGMILTTLGVDIWVDLPSRQDMRLAKICLSQGETALSPVLYALSDGRLVNFLFEVNGLGPFRAEYKKAINSKIGLQPVKILPLESILKSKKAIMRDKDGTHIFHIERVLQARKRTGTRK
jgi:hypothetical protein